MNHDDPPLTLSASNEALVVLIIRIICLGLLGYWSLILIAPFLTTIVWSIIIAVAVYPIFEALSAKFHGHYKLAAITITVFGLFVILGPATWLGLSLAASAQTLIARLGEGTAVIPSPPQGIKAWPLIGDRAYDIWQLDSTNLRDLLIETAPQLKPLGSRLLNAAGSVGINLLKFVLAAIISGFLLIPGPALVESIKNILAHVVGNRGEEFLKLAGATIRNVSRGVIGIAMLQALLAGIGLLVARFPAAGLFSFLVLLLGILQIGPSLILIPLIVWSWFRMDAMMALLFTVYMLPVNLLDNILRPLLAKGLNTPMPVILIGLVGGTLAHGMIGLFVGPIVLSIAWQLLLVWTRSSPKNNEVVE
jgi:predicted PurR-regulated permease PerM